MGNIPECGEHMIYIFDLDGTLADISHRLHFIEQKPQDWKAFFAACVDDKPIVEVIDVLLALHSRGHEIVIFTGRSDEVEDETVAWLECRRIPFTTMFMRKAGDHRPDHIVKSELLDSYYGTWKWHDDALGERIAGVFEDRQQVVDMYRARGLRVFQVAEGKF